MTGHAEFLGQVLTESAATARDYFGRVEPGRKGPNGADVVTEADLAIGAAIVRAIGSAFPTDGVVEEETGVLGGTSDTVWVVDPIDGTANFAAGSPLYGVMVGVLRDGAPVAGGVALPAFGELYLAERGAGAHRDGVPLTRAHRGELSESLVAYGIDLDEPARTRRDLATIAAIAEHCQGLRMSNSVFDLIMVATGAYGAFLHRHSQIWDCVAPQVVLTEAGVRCSDFAGAPLDYRDPQARAGQDFAMLAAAPRLHGRLLGLVR
ncbi:inositol monophosphatase family protein [Amycolatopsis aidingensis]|uniref:inositol monophosphatase family protein n=1 Tax=Amycolatopsis aidingensis TaxID=2842453 RepID=UPI001C0CC26E|nr:inositol monophosphatase [Amycolatopsis aidingensis]